ncbi:MAG: aminotransferase class I/II-fold pyridoxal phosphate-dependent enzyme, partial [Pseudomonas sp.]|uniref:aminotransferase class I/II-fold pyridoxal phosphate-dependent enzyme n=1 Tax=Pseudomonas sp. TaxID=306 RepID=UPI00391A9E69
VYIGADLRGVLDILIDVLGLRGTTVIVESPCDWQVLRLLQDAGVRILELPWTPAGGLDRATLEQLLRDETVHLVMFSSKVSLPSGVTMSRCERQETARLLGQHGCWLLENDTFGALSFDSTHTPLRELVNPERLIVFSSFDKLLGSEAPYGYLLSRHLSTELQRQFLQRAFRVSSIRQRAIARLYQSGRIDQHLGSLRQQLCEQATQMSRRLDQQLGDQVAYHMPAAGAAFWLASTRAVDMRQVFQRLLAQQVVIAPGELFSVSGLHHQNLRFSHTFHGQPDLDIALTALSDALHKAQTS